MLYLNCPKVINPSVHARYMQCAYKVHERIMQGSCKVHKRFMQGAYKQDGGFSTYGYGERAGSCGEYLRQISFKLAGQCDANMLQSFQCNGQLQRWQEGEGMQQALGEVSAVVPSMMPGMPCMITTCNTLQIWLPDLKLPCNDTSLFGNLHRHMLALH